MSVNVGSSNSSATNQGSFVQALSKDSIKESRVENLQEVKRVTYNPTVEESQEETRENSEAKYQLQEWVERMNSVVKENVKFNFSEELGSIYVTVVDSTTNEVIRTIPTEDALQLSAIWKDAIGNIFDRKG
jgi:flagellar protein FlaG